MKKWFAFFAVVTSLSGACFAQEKPTANKEQQAKQKQTKEQPAPMAPAKQESKKPPVMRFSIGMLENGRVDPRYMGFPVAKMIDAIEKVTGVKKGEFESTADYNARRSATLAGKLLGDSSIEDFFAFVVPAPKWEEYSSGLRYEFNADTSDVNLYVLPTSSKYVSLNGIGAPDYDTNRREREGLDQFELSTKIESKSTYQGSNAYGATVTVEQTIMSRLGIAANPLSFLSFERDLMYSNPTIVGQFKLENSRAARELPALKALIVMKLADPYIVYNFKHVEPTRDNPVDISMQEKLLTGNVIGIVFYSGLTGEIFARIPETFGKPVTMLEPAHEDNNEKTPSVQEKQTPQASIKDTISSFADISKLPTNSGGITLVTPVEAENGNVVPVDINIGTPLHEGDTLIVTGDGKQALELTSATHHVTMVSTRLRLVNGNVAAYVFRADGTINSSNKNVRIGIPGRPASMSNEQVEIKHKIVNGELKMLFKNEMAEKGHIREIIVSPSSGGDIRIRTTEWLSPNPYIGVTCEHKIDSVRISAKQ